MSLQWNYTTDRFITHIRDAVHSERNILVAIGTEEKEGRCNWSYGDAYHMNVAFTMKGKTRAARIEEGERRKRKHSLARICKCALMPFHCSKRNRIPHPPTAFS